MKCALALVLALAACGSGERAPTVLTPIPVGGRIDKVDILFMMDDSPSNPYVSEVKARFPALAAELELPKPFPVSYHFGVVTSDLGAGPFTLGGGQCHPDGDGGKLQLLGAAADTACKPVTGGVRFIDYSTDGTNNLPAGQDLPTTFGCMASVGDKGCGFEHQLESVYRALHDPPPENAGFLRDDALLVVYFVTDEDDCSFPPDSDVGDPSKTAEYGALLSYRCTHLGVTCNGMLMPNGPAGPFTDCHGATAEEGGKLFDPQRYIDFFTKPRAQAGIKDDPGMVVLGAISPPASPVESLNASPSPMPPGPYQSCSGPVDGMTCATVVQHSCFAPMNSQFFGDPAVRLRQVVDSSRYPLEWSLCDLPYQTPLDSLGSAIISAKPLNCLPRAPLDPANPNCVSTSDWTVEAEPHCASGYRILVEEGAQVSCELVAP